MKLNLPGRVLKEIAFYAKKNNIQNIILFGSRARGNCTERSDIDIAVSGGDVNGFYEDVKENIYSLLSFDIVDLDAGISDQLKEEIEKDGIVIYEKA